MPHKPGHKRIRGTATVDGKRAKVLSLRKGEKPVSAREFEKRIEKQKPREETEKKTTQEKRPTIDITGTAPEPQEILTPETKTEDVNFATRVQRRFEDLSESIAEVIRGGPAKEEDKKFGGLDITALAKGAFFGPTLSTQATGVFNAGQLIGKGKGGFIKGAIVNPKTRSQTIEWGIKVAKQFKKPPFVATALAIALYTAIKEGVGGSVFKDFVGMEEAAQQVGGPKWVAYQQGKKTGDWTIFEEARALEDELYKDNTMWENVISNIPWLNGKVGLNDFRQAGIDAGNLWDELAKNEIIQQQTGETDEEKWARIGEKQKQDDIDVIDYYNQQRIITDKIIEDLEDQDMKDDAAFWRNERAIKRKEEREDLIALGKFWQEYRIEANKIQENSRPSNLNFGLL